MSTVQLMNKARAVHAQGDFLAAARGYETILKLDPRNYDAAYALAVALYQQGRLERAAAAFAVAAALSPRRVEPHKDHGLVLMKLGQHEAALASFETATRLMPDSPELLLNRGMAQKNSGRIAESIASYEAALRLRPAFAEAHNNLANSLSLLGRKEDALAAYRQAIALKPGYAEAYVNAAALHLQLEQPSEAMALLEKVIATQPRHAEAHRNLAECLRALARPEEALAAATRAVDCDPASLDARLTRASILEEAARYADALDDYASVLSRDPRNKDALLGQAQILCSLARYDEAVALCDIAIAAHPEDARPYYQIGRAFEGRRELSAAVRSYEKAAGLDPEWLAPVLRRASALGDMGRHEDALAVCEAALATHGGKASVHVGMGHALRGLQRLGEALASYDRAIALSPDEPLYFGMRGSLKTEMGSAEEALADFGQGLKILARGKPAAEVIAEHCIKLLSVDKIPAIYASEADLARTRDNVEVALDELAGIYGGQQRLSAEQTRISEQAIRQLTGFYLAYHQRNDRETMTKLSRAAAGLLSLAPFDVPARRAHGGRIRVGIASHRLRDHNGANWAYNWFAYLPRDDYDIFTYCFETANDPLAQKFAALGTHRALTWSRATPHELVRQMRNDNLDILMLTDVGMTPVSRFLSLHRIAPCQFTAWGHPVTTGSPEMDFYLSSDLMEPPGAQDHYSETLIRMPNLALYLDDEKAAEAPATRAGLGLPEGRVLYGCLQSLFKYLPRHDAILPLIARDVPDALFVFLEGSHAFMTEVMRERLNTAFMAHGLDAARHVTFLPRRKSSEFDALMQAMDVCIDSVGWSGGNTTLKTIGLRVPLATLEGAFMRGRHSSAMFRMIGAEELIATSEEDYVAMLVRLGKEQAYRRHATELFRQGAPRLYRDESFIRAFDAFLKSQSQGGISQRG